MNGPCPLRSLHAPRRTPVQVVKPNWKTGNKPSRDLFNRKCFYYREIARQANELGSIKAALIATQARLDEHKSARSPGWSAFLKVLQSEQPVGIVRDDLNRKLDEMQTSD